MITSLDYSIGTTTIEVTVPVTIFVMAIAGQMVA